MSSTSLEMGFSRIRRVTDTSAWSEPVRTSPFSIRRQIWRLPKGYEAVNRSRIRQVLVGQAQARPGGRWPPDGSRVLQRRREGGFVGGGFASASRGRMVKSFWMAVRPRPGGRVGQSEGEVVQGSRRPAGTLCTRQVPALDRDPRGPWLIHSGVTDEEVRAWMGSAGIRISSSAGPEQRQLEQRVRPVSAIGAVAA